MEPGRLETALERETAGWAREHLVADVIGWLTTVTEDGTPQSSVISFLWEGNTILFDSQPDTPKLRNIARSPLVSFHLQSDAYGDHLLIVEGRAEIDPSIPSSDANEAYRTKYREPLAHWAMDEATTAAEFSVPVRIHPTRVRIA